MSGEVLNPLHLYLKEINLGSPLTREEEVALAQQIELGKLARERLTFVPSSNVPLSEEASGRLRLLDVFGEIAKGRLIKCNLGLVVYVAKKFQGNGVPLLDLIQEGNIGLMRAVDKFDWRRGYKFNTYAYWWIRRDISRHISGSRFIPLPGNVGEEIAQMKTATGKLEQQLGREPVPGEIADYMVTTKERVITLNTVRAEPISLFSPVNHTNGYNNGYEDGTIADFIPDQNQLPEEAAELTQLRDLLEERMEKSGLTEKQEKVLRLRFGLDDGIGRSLEEIGQIMGCTREWIRQVEQAAFAKIRTPENREVFAEYLN